MLALLKQKSKVGFVQKSRKKYELADVFKARPRNDGAHAYKN